MKILIRDTLPGRRSILLGSPSGADGLTNSSESSTIEPMATQNHRVFGLVAAFAAILLFLGALVVSSFHVHEDDATQDNCPVCRFQHSTTSTEPTVASDCAVPEFTPLVTLHSTCTVPLDLFRFSTNYAHAPPAEG